VIIEQNGKLDLHNIQEGKNDPEKAQSNIRHGKTISQKLF